MSWGETEDARAICEQLLKITGDALLAGDFDTFAACFHLPHFMSTTDAKASIETTTALKQLFEKTIDSHRRKRVTDVIRKCDVCNFRSPTHIGSTHTTHLMSGSQRIAEPFPSFSTIELIDGVWKITSSHYALDKTLAIGAALHAHNATTADK
ncbi:hypothetical protein [uncultured Sulfitobacter sp.]|uniref:hypothetical protein n=1 Tax=uncultured Sulfitobacter sp. TaxID=191468 RepID=UPI002638B896|nr:hypothetical protein [uncultured Sulfitobacter sp.]